MIGVVCGGRRGREGEYEEKGRDGGGKEGE